MMLRRSILSLSVIFFASTALAHKQLAEVTLDQSRCNQALMAAQMAASRPKPQPGLFAFTGTTLRKAAVDRYNWIYQAVPPRGFDMHEVEAANEQIADPWAPLSFQQMLPEGIGFVSTPTQSSPEPSTTGILAENFSFPLFAENQWHGRRTSTVAYVFAPVS